MPTSLFPASVALSRSAYDVEIARSVLAFWGRPDVDVRAANEDIFGALSGFNPAVVIGATYPDTIDADITTLNQALAAVPQAQMIAAMLTDPNRIKALQLQGFELAMKTLLGHRFVPEPWQQATLFVFRKPR